MNTIKTRPYLKLIALKIDVFESKIVDERHFAPDDSKAIALFTQKYPEDEYQIVQVMMCISML